MEITKYIPNFIKHETFIRLEWRSRLWYMPWIKQHYYMEIIGWSTSWNYFPSGKMCGTLTTIKILEAIKRYHYKQLNKEQSDD